MSRRFTNEFLTGLIKWGMLTESLKTIMFLWKHGFLSLDIYFGLWPCYYNQKWRCSVYWLKEGLQSIANLLLDQVSKGTQLRRLLEIQIYWEDRDEKEKRRWYRKEEEDNFPVGTNHALMTSRDTSSSSSIHCSFPFVMCHQFQSCLQSCCTFLSRLIEELHVPSSRWHKNSTCVENEECSLWYPEFNETIFETSLDNCVSLFLCVSLFAFLGLVSKEVTKRESTTKSNKPNVCLVSLSFLSWLPVLSNVKTRRWSWDSSSDVIHSIDVRDRRSQITMFAQKDVCYAIRLCHQWMWHY